MSQKTTLRKPFRAFATCWKLAVNGTLLLRLHDVVSVDHKRHALQPLELEAVNARTFRSVDHVRVRGAPVLSRF